MRWRYLTLLPRKYRYCVHSLSTSLIECGQTPTIRANQKPSPTYREGCDIYIYITRGIESPVFNRLATVLILLHHDAIFAVVVIARLDIGTHVTSAFVQANRGGIADPNRQRQQRLTHVVFAGF